MPDVYTDTIGRMEPDIAAIDPGGGFASMAISLKRIADALELRNVWEGVVDADYYKRKSDAGT